MNPMMITGGAAVLFAVLAAVQTARLGSAQEEIGELSAKMNIQVAETRQAVGVTETLNTSIDTLTERIAVMVEGRRLEREANDRLLAARDNDIATANALARRLEGERDEIFRQDFGCNEMGSIRIDSVCPAIGDQLRKLTTRRIGDGRDSNG